MTPAPADVHGEDGSSPINAVFGVAIFLIFVLFASQVLLHLYGTSVVTATAFDAARLVAGQDATTPVEAEQRARELLGEYGADPSVAFDWSGSTADQVVLVVDGPSPARLVSALTELAGLDGIRREVRVRVEEFRP